MKHIKQFNEEMKSKWDLPENRNKRFQEKQKSKKIEHQLDPHILAHNIKHNIDDFSEEQILNLFVTYAEQNK